MNRYNNPRLTNTTVSGTGVKHPMRPHVILGDPENGFIRGDLLDANAVIKLIKNAARAAGFPQLASSLDWVDVNDDEAMIGEIGYVIAKNSNGDDIKILAVKESNNVEDDDLGCSFILTPGGNNVYGFPAFMDVDFLLSDSSMTVKQLLDNNLVDIPVNIEKNGQIIGFGGFEYPQNSYAPYQEDILNRKVSNIKITPNDKNIEITTSYTGMGHDDDTMD